MRHRLPTLILGLLTAAALTGSAAARYAQQYGTPVGAEVPDYGTILAGDDGTFELWGASPEWAEEQQVGFIMPAGGPWTVWMALVWMSGTAPQRLVVRTACGSVWNAPCDVEDESIVFTPGYAAPPDRWVEVDLLEAGLVLGEGEEIFVGVTLDGGDAAIGLDSQSHEGHSWGHVAGVWENDAYDWGAHAAIRLVLTDTSFGIEPSTWGAIRALFFAAEAQMPSDPQP